MIAGAPLSFALVCLLGLVLIYFILDRYVYHERLAAKDDLIRTYREKLGLPATGESIAIGERAGKAELQVRFSQTEPYWFKESAKDVTHYRMGIYNRASITAENVQLLLTDIEPKPASPLFPADFPYRVRRAFSPVAKLEGCRINPADEELFELLSFWTGGDEQLYVDGIDTKREPSESRYSRFPMEPCEKWKLKYKITSANADEQTVTFSARQEKQNIILVLD